MRGDGWDTVVIVASGPSLTAEQCGFITAQRDSGRCRIIAINSSWRAVPSRDVLYACDRNWWKRYHEEAPGQAEGWTADPWSAGEYGLNLIKLRGGEGICAVPGMVHGGKNSGYQAIGLAYHFGARRIILVGYDMQHTGGKRHWHDDHPKGMGNCEGIKGWVKQFDSLPGFAKPLGIELFNATIETAITGIERKTLWELFNESSA